VNKTGISVKHIFKAFRTFVPDLLLFKQNNPRRKNCNDYGEVQQDSFSV
jgi:hypothetical protein